MKLFIVQLLIVHLTCFAVNIIYCGTNENLICDDFYKYACSDWIKSNSKPYSEPYWNVYTETAHRISQTLQHILENASFINIEHEKQLYDTCVQTKSDYIKEFRNLIFKLGGVQAVKSSRITYDFLMHVIEVTKLLNIHPVLKLHVEKKLIHIDRGDFIYPEVFLRQPQLYIDELKVYRNWIEKTFVFLDANLSGIGNAENLFVRFLRGSKHRLMNARTLAKEVVDFEIKLAQLPSGKLIKKSKDIIGSNFAFKFLLEGVSDDHHVISHVVINEVYFESVLSLVHHTPIHIVSNYIIWASIKELSRDVNADFRQLSFEVDRELLGITADIPREFECVQQVVKLCGYENLLHNFDLITRQDENATLANVHELANKIKQTFLKYLRNNKWLANRTKESILSHIKSIQFEIFRPKIMKPETTSVIKLDNNHLVNLLKLKTHKYANNLKKLILSVNETDEEDLQWPSNIFDVNAFYNPRQNAIILPVGILQPPFYDFSQPSALNYGGLGSLIGHELSHALDNLNKHNFTRMEHLSYNKRRSCIKSIYDSFGIDQGLKLNENIADFMGLRLSYYTMHEEHANDVMDEGYSELFFLSYAKMWCELPNKDNKNLLNHDEHSPVAVRVDGTLRHLNVFHKIFNCPHEHDNNEYNCNLW